MKGEYNEKEIAVYQGVLALIEEGQDLYSLRVSEIADAAGIGKGTIYNYFTSKEQIIVRTLLYCFYEQIRALRDLIEQQHSFKDKVYVVLSTIQQGRGRSLMQMVLTNFSPQQIKPCIGTYADEIHAMLKALFDRIDSLLAYGRQEGVIAYSDEEYAHYVFVCALTSFIQSCTLPFPLWHPEKAKEYAYSLIVKGLAPQA